MDIPMTLTQILIIGLLLVIDVYVLSMIMYNKQHTAITKAISAIKFVYGNCLLLVIVVLLNKKADEANGKCPKYEQVTETFYRLK